MKIPSPPPRHALEPAPEEQAFRFSTGERAHNLIDLAAELRRVPPGTAWFHREHFAPWVRGVVGDDPLARRFEHYAGARMDPEVYRDTMADLVDARVEALRRLRAAATPGAA